MSHKLRINPLKFLVFLLPASLPIIFSLPVEWMYVIYARNIGINNIAYAIAFIYPIVSAIVFVRNKFFLWSAPVVYAVFIISTALIFGLTHGALPLFMMELAAIVWSLVCSLVAFLVR